MEEGVCLLRRLTFLLKKNQISPILELFLITLNFSAVRGSEE